MSKFEVNHKISQTLLSMNTVKVGVAITEAVWQVMINLQEPCVLYKGRARRYPQHSPFFIFFQQIHVLNFLNMLHTLHFFLFKMTFIS
jgi:hypothetical protein